MTDGKKAVWYAEVDFYEDGSYRQTNGSSFATWLVEHDEAVRQEARERCAQTEMLVAMICLIAEDPAPGPDGADEALGDVLLLIADHWGLTEFEQDADRVSALQVELEADAKPLVAFYAEQGDA